MGTQKLLLLTILLGLFQLSHHFAPAGTQSLIPQRLNTQDLTTYNADGASE